MSVIGLAEAARLTGKHSSTIHRAMKTGRISYTVSETGERRIDVSELERVFGIKSNGAMPGNDAATVHGNDSQGGELAALQRLLDDRERTIAELHETIRDYRQRLDNANEHARHLLALLTDQRERSWWRRVIR